MTTQNPAELLKGNVPLDVLRARRIPTFSDGFIHVQDQKPANSAGGSNSTSFLASILNTVLTNTISGASLSSNQITLPAGTYFIDAGRTFAGGGFNKVKLYNVTGTADILISLTGSTSAAAAVNGLTTLSGTFTLSGTAVLELQHRCSASVATNGLGLAANLGVIEAYADVKIWRIA